MWNVPAVIGISQRSRVQVSKEYRDKTKTWSSQVHARWTQKEYPYISPWLGTPSKIPLGLINLHASWSNYFLIINIIFPDVRYHPMLLDQKINTHVHRSHHKFSVKGLIMRKQMDKLQLNWWVLLAGDKSMWLNWQERHPHFEFFWVRRFMVINPFMQQCICYSKYGYGSCLGCSNRFVKPVLY